MKFQIENKTKNNSEEKNEKIQNDMDLLLERLPVLNEYFELHDKIGQGTFSNVYVASLRNSNSTQKYAIKHLTQAYEQSMVQIELRCLQEIGGKDNVVPAELCLTNGSDCVTFIMPYLPHIRFADYVVSMDAEETRLYMKNLFIALKRVHSFNIIHRDVKPDNFLYNRESKQFLLVDFGLAQLVRTPNHDALSYSCATNENMPLNFSKKRKRIDSSEDESKSPAKGIKRMALKSKDNNIKLWNTSNSSNDVKIETIKQNFSTNGGPEPLRIQKATVLKDENVHKPRIFNNPGVPSNSKQRLIDSSEMIGFSKTSFKNDSKVKNLAENMSENKMPFVLNQSNSPLPGRGGSKNTKRQATSSKLMDSATSQKYRPTTSFSVQTCPCSGKGAICSFCSSKEKMYAPRAGTCGFRAPEVLFRYLYQTTAIDMWASGVVMLCILSGSYPFFNVSKDMVSLAEIMTVFGTERTIKVASKFGRKILCSEYRKGVDLKKLCTRLRARAASKTKSENNYANEPKCRDCFQTIRSDGCICPSDNVQEPSAKDTPFVFPDSAFDLLYRLLDLDPTTRITAAEALEHPFITEV